MLLLAINRRHEHFVNQIDLKELLSKGLRQLNLAQPLDDKQQSTLIKYVELLNKWNKTYNLTAVRKPEQMVTRHLLDSLSICPYLRGKSILDVGTGAGLPGIPLAITYPERQFTLLDSNNKKTRFVTQAVSELGIKNITIVLSRVEEYKATPLFDTIMSRAYSSIANMIAGTQQLLNDDGVFIAMKGIYPIAELDELPVDMELVENHQLYVPGLDGERHLLVIQKNK
jgi:16S rRNA (guanine527-N7)-methyltransferase